MNKLEAVKVDTMISRTRNSIKDNVEMVVKEEKSGEESKA